VGILSRKVAFPTELHWATVKRLLPYHNGTQDYGIQISHQSDILAGHANADWGGESDRKSVSGFVITAGRVPISWGCRKQTAIALSTTEAEYASLSEASREVTWIRNLCESPGHKRAREKRGATVPVHTLPTPDYVIRALCAFGRRMLSPPISVSSLEMARSGLTMFGRTLTSRDLL
jgi:hypothetical protein